MWETEVPILSNGKLKLPGGDIAPSDPNFHEKMESFIVGNIPTVDLNSVNFSVNHISAILNGDEKQISESIKKSGLPLDAKKISQFSQFFLSDENLKNSVEKLVNNPHFISAETALFSGDLKNPAIDAILNSPETAEIFKIATAVLQKNPSLQTLISAEIRKTLEFDRAQNLVQISDREISFIANNFIDFLNPKILPDVLAIARKEISFAKFAARHPIFATRFLFS